MKIAIEAAAQKALTRRIPQAEAKRIMAELARLAADPTMSAGDVKPLTGRPGTFRLRVGDWRVFYRVEDDTLWVVGVGNRKDVYR